MSGDEAVRKSRELNPTCGCEKRGDRQFNCSYHEGFIDGCEAGRSAVIQECAEVTDYYAKQMFGEKVDAEDLAVEIGNSIRALKER